ncbi:MAG: general secretion pathway protein GspB [Mariprofundales bacterium]
MSYILEALQRADQERKRSQEIAMPSVIHATMQHQPTSQWSRGLGWGIALLLLALLIWGQLAPTNASIQPQASIKIAAPIQPLPLAQVAPPKLATTAVPRAHPVTKVTQLPAATPPSLSEPIPLEALPFLIRKQLPEIHISALIDHQDPARRVAWINDRSRHIGAWLTESVRLIAISEHSITLEFQGYHIVVTPL